VLAYYRVHGNNLGAMADLQPSRLHRQIIRAQQRFDYMKRIADQTGLTVNAPGPQVSLHYLMYRAASFRVSPSDHPIRGDSRLLLVKNAFIAALEPQGFTLLPRALMFLWVCGVMYTPISFAEWLMRIRFDSKYRASQKDKLKNMLVPA
jgi:hypothetical protein